MGQSSILLRRSPVAFWVLLILTFSVPSHSQGFGTMVGTKKRVFLHRKLPAAIHLTASSFAVKATAHDKSQADVAQSLSDILVTELQKGNSLLGVDQNSPGVVISCAVTRFEIPPPQSFTRNEVVLEKGHSLEEPKKFYKVSGTLEVAYQAKDGHSGKIFDSENLAATYSNEYEEGSNQAADKSLTSKVVDPFRRAAGKKTEESSGPPTPIDIRQDLIHQVVSQIAMTLVNTDETVEVYLARGKLESANKLAEAGLWSRDLETLETMSPFPNPKDDAYRLYNIGVANEALAYQTDDQSGAKKFIEQAAINYGKAIDAKPDERYFHEPQKRIETAAAYYKRLQDRRQSAALAASTPPAPPKTSEEAPAAASLAKPSHTAAFRKSTAGAAKNTAPTGLVTNALLKQKDASPRPELTNAKVIEMFKSGVDEENIIATIRQSTRVQFDISPDGQIELAKNGVKGKILAAMRERARRSGTSPP